MPTGREPRCVCGECRLCKKRESRRRNYVPKRSTRLRRFPIEPLLEVVDPGVLRPIASAEVYRWIRRGWISEVQADRVATWLRVHPSQIWPEWFEEFEDAV